MNPMFMSSSSNDQEESTSSYMQSANDVEETTRMNQIQSPLPQRMQPQQYQSSGILTEQNVLNMPTMSAMDLSWHNPMASFLHYSSKKSDGLRKGKWTVCFVLLPICRNS